MSNQLTTRKFSVNQAENLYSDIEAGNPYYVFTAKPDPYSGNSDQTIPDPIDSIKDGIIDIYDDMLFGKRVQTTDASMMSPRHDWVANTVFTMYDDVDGNLHGKNFYACVNVGSQVNMYKCLFNNNDSPSTVSPSGTDTQSFETPNDGYIWKYMCSANDYSMSKFATNDYVPITVDQNVLNSAVNGAVDIIVVDTKGQGYNNYISDDFKSEGDIRIGGSVYTYALGPSASSIPGFYKNCLIKITSGAAKNQHAIITDYYISNGQKIITIDVAFTQTVKVTDTYEITPYVYVYDAGNQKTVNCVARAIIDTTSGNSISKIDVLNPGSGYRKAVAKIKYDAAVPVTSNAVLRPIMPPPGGHGSDLACEMTSNHVGVSVQFVGNETPFIADNDYRTIGLIKSPLISNVTVSLDTTLSIGLFAVGELVNQVTPLSLYGTVNVQASNVVISGQGVSFDQVLTVGDQVLVYSNTASYSSNVVSISGSSSITIASNATFTANGCQIALITNKKPVGYVNTRNTGQVFISNVNPIPIESIYLLGDQSSAVGYINQSVSSDQHILINDRSAEGFAKFTQLTRFTGTISSGSFVNDEYVKQNSVLLDEVPVARVFSTAHSNSAVDYMYVNGVNFNFLANGTYSDGMVLGQTSNAVFIINDKYNINDVIIEDEKNYIENETS